MTIKEEVDKIIEDLNRIPRKVETEQQIDVKKIAEEVSKVLERKLWRSY